MSIVQHGSWTLRKAKTSAFVVGCFSGLGLVAYTRISLWRKDAEVLREYPALASHEKKEGDENDTILFGRVMRQYLIHHWNTGVVDAVAKPAIECLASKGW